MALIKKADLPSGIVGDYWKITSVQLDIIRGQMHVVVSLFISADARQANKSPAWRLDKTFATPSLTDRQSNDIVELAYTALKTDVDFSGAQDA